MITITRAAELYLAKLKIKHPEEVLRLLALDPNTPYAEAALILVKPIELATDDVLIGYPGFQLFVEKRSLPYLKDASIDIAMKNLQTEVIITTPNLIPLQLETNEGDLFETVQLLIDRQINPVLAQHGGMVQLVDITQDHVVLVRFRGGCQGCSQVDLTMKNGIKETLLNQITFLKDVIDVTDHQKGEKPYFYSTT